MKRNLIITIQSSFESNLTTQELDERIRRFVKYSLSQIEGAEPVGTYLISIESGPPENFPRSIADPNEIVDPNEFDEPDDLVEVKRRLAFEKVAGIDDTNWDDEDSNGG